MLVRQEPESCHRVEPIRESRGKKSVAAAALFTAGLLLLSSCSSPSQPMSQELAVETLLGATCPVNDFSDRTAPTSIEAMRAEANARAKIARESAATLKDPPAPWPSDLDDAPEVVSNFYEALATRWDGYKGLRSMDDVAAYEESSFPIGEDYNSAIKTLGDFLESSDQMCP